MADYVYGTSAFQLVDDISNPVLYQSTTRDAIMAGLKVIDGNAGKIVDTAINSQGFNSKAAFSVLNGMKDSGVVMKTAADGTVANLTLVGSAPVTVEGAASAATSAATTSGTIQAAPMFKVVEGVGGAEIAPVTATVGSNVLRFFSTAVVPAISAVGLGIQLGKLIDSALYNFNPDFWDSVGMSSLNPETWASITAGDDSIFAGLFNMVFGIDPTTGAGQTYMDERAAAYTAWYMKEMGLFDDTIAACYQPALTNVTLNVPLYKAESDFSTEKVFLGNTYYATQPIYSYTNGAGHIITERFFTNQLIHKTTKIDLVALPIQVGSSTTWVMEGALPEDPAQIPAIGTMRWNETTNQLAGATTPSSPSYYEYDGRGVRYRVDTSDSHAPDTLVPLSPAQPTGYQGPVAYTTKYGTFDPGLPGVTDVEGATLPDTSDWTDLDSTLESLREQYPDWFARSETVPVLQPDGSTKYITYIPTATPEAPWQQSPQPVSVPQPQTNPLIEPAPTPDIDPDTAPWWRTILKEIVQPLPDTQTDPSTTPSPAPSPSPYPQNVPWPSTGGGSSPVSTLPAGNASAMWSVYHPSQAEVNQLGAWLWTNDPLAQLAKIFNDPMETIISLHKVFATPVDSGTGHIVLGRIDSGINTHYVTQQYVTVDCGNVDVREYYGNVIDYVGTDISLYLPFIGVVPLNVSDVMRGRLHVFYRVDIFTGACLASVEVIRDGETAVLYQYAGSAAVEYPLSGARNAGLLSGILGVAGTVATVATGGAGGALVKGATAALGAAGSVAGAAVTSYARAGSLSGNAGAMGIKIPYVIIERQAAKIADGFADLEGYPTNIRTTIGSCSGFVRVTTARVRTAATEDEKNAIMEMLRNGIIV